MWEAPITACEILQDWTRRAAANGIRGNTYPAPGQIWDDLSEQERADVLGALGAQARVAITLGTMHPWCNWQSVTAAYSHQKLSLCPGARELLDHLMSPEGGAGVLPPCGQHCATEIARTLATVTFLTYRALGFHSNQIERAWPACPEVSCPQRESARAG